VLVSNSFASNVLYFYVHDHIPVLSDHAKITININCSFEETVTPNFDCGTTVPPAYVWNKTSDIPFLEAFSDPEVKNKMLMFDEYVKEGCISTDSPADTDILLRKFNDILYTACKRSLKIKSCEKTKHNQPPSRNKKW
jgi:hypothetical protein